MAQIDVIIIALYFVSVLWIGLYYAHRGSDTVNNYFRAGQNLTWIILGFSLFATNISSEHFVGLAGYGAHGGLAAGMIEWLAILFLIVLAWVFLPVFIRADIFTIPEFLGKRFNKAVQYFHSSISIFAYLLTKISISLFAGGLLLHAMLGWDMYSSAIAMVIITGIYTVMGGLRAVVFTSFFQAFILLAGAILITILGLNEIGGPAALKASLDIHYFELFKSASDPDFPWTGILFGAPVLAVWYWCTDQYIVQKLLGARSVSHARNGALLTGFLKILPPFVLLLPGMIAIVLYPTSTAGEAYAALLNASFLPLGMKGLIISAILAALMSSLSSAFISVSTLFTIDFYKSWFPESTEKKLVLVGRLSTIAVVIFGVLWIPVLKVMTADIYVYLQTFQACISPPIAAVFLLGFVWKRSTGVAALWTLGLGSSIGLLRIVLTVMDSYVPVYSGFFGWILQLNYLHFAAILFMFSVGIMGVVSWLTAPIAAGQLRVFLKLKSDALQHFSMQGRKMGILPWQPSMPAWASVFLVIILIIAVGIIL